MAQPRATTVSGKRFVIALVVFVVATLAVYPLVRRHVMQEHARERAAELARERARDAQPR